MMYVSRNPEDTVDPSDTNVMSMNVVPSRISVTKIQCCNKIKHQRRPISYKRDIYITVKPVFKTSWEIGTTWELRAAILVPMPIQYIEMDLRKKNTSEFRTVFHSPLGVPNSQVSL